MHVSVSNVPLLTASAKEEARHYIPLSEADEALMKEVSGVPDLDALFSHIDPKVRFSALPGLPEELTADAARERLQSLADRNQPLPGFLGDGLGDWAQPAIVGKVASLRRLATSYTPYQPERSQGTLNAHWIFQCFLSALTGFEAVNTSLYERSTAMFEALLCGLRLVRGSSKVAYAATLPPGDIAVLRTHFSDTTYELIELPLEQKCGTLDLAAAERLITAEKGSLAAVVFPQVNTFGLIEPVDALTDLCADHGIKSVAVVDPLHLAPGGLKTPVEFGRQGTDMVVGEAQHLALGLNFGGPGLGIFGIRYRADAPGDVRQAPGRFVGPALDRQGREGRIMILSTREQHIRREKATSNICSNQAFVATLIGAALAGRGTEGLADALGLATGRARQAFEKLTACEGVQPAFPEGSFLHEFTLELDRPVAEVLQQALAAGFLAGADVSARLPGSRSLLKLTFTDKTQMDLVDALASLLGSSQQNGHCPLPVESASLRQSQVFWPRRSEQEVYAYYCHLDALNAAPEESCYPLGSCTMKYNPYLNEWAANLPGFTDCHPAAPEETVQGCLELLYQIQEWFVGMTGLAAVTTQPVAGAQGELAGLKMIQAYHRDRGDLNRRSLLIPKSAHGTNFATAAMAGFNGKDGIVLLQADATGRIDMADLEAKISQYGSQLAGIMVTNPNTGGIFEDNFAAIAEKIHAVGGLVYMDGANLNAIVGRVNLGAIGVDAVHSNLHKTFTIPHGGGGPGDGIVAVSEKLADFLPGKQIIREGDVYRSTRPVKSIGTLHRHWGNFAHKVRCYAYLIRLGRVGVPRMSGTAVLAARYLHSRLQDHFPTLPSGSDDSPRMHEFILTLTEEQFAALSGVGLSRAQAIPAVGKMFLDFGYHAPTVAFPEPLGLMFEPTESHTLLELDRLVEATVAIGRLILSHPQIVRDGPHFCPLSRFDEVAANRAPVFATDPADLPVLPEVGVSPRELVSQPVEAIVERLIEEVAVSA